MAKKKQANKLLSLAGEFAVASELCRRGVYAQPTFGNQKKTDLLILTGSGQASCVEVKASETKEWAWCKGIAGSHAFLVFVDFYGKSLTQRPDFYILTFADWCKLVDETFECLQRERGNREKFTIERSEGYYIQSNQRIGGSQSPVKGMIVKRTAIQDYLERWDKITGGGTAGGGAATV